MIEARLQALGSKWVGNTTFEIHDPGPWKQKERKMDLVKVRSKPCTT